MRKETQNIVDCVRELEGLIDKCDAIKNRLKYRYSSSKIDIHLICDVFPDFEEILSDRLKRYESELDVV